MMKYTVYKTKRDCNFFQELTLQEAVGCILGKKFEVRPTAGKNEVIWFLYVWYAPSKNFRRENIFSTKQLKEEAEKEIFTEICEKAPIFTNFEVVTDAEFVNMDYYSCSCLRD